MSDILSGGVLAIDKPAGMTSFDVVARIRRLYGTRQVGHTGTLDPMATGVMVVLIGRAVKASEYVTAHTKKYKAGLLLGVKSDTLDTTGNVERVADEKDLPDDERVQEVLSSFRGKIIQVPPMYSALKVGGVKLCDAARRGIEIERQGREIEIFSLESERVSKSEYTLDVFCSKGTYIRTLCDDIGSALSCGGVMSSLRRTASGAFTLGDCHTLEEIEQLSGEERQEILSPVDMLFRDLEEINLDPFFARLARTGNPIFQSKIGKDIKEDVLVRFYDGGRFFAIARSIFDSEGQKVLKPVKQFDI